MKIKKKMNTEKFYEFMAGFVLLVLISLMIGGIIVHTCGWLVCSVVFGLIIGTGGYTAYNFVEFGEADE